MHIEVIHATGTPGIQRRLASRIGSCLRVCLEAVAVGLLVALIDIQCTGDGTLTILLYVAAAALLGLRHAGHACPIWPVLGSSLYVVHVIAIACGRKPPFVETDSRNAEGTLEILFPVVIGLTIGVVLRVALSALGRLPRKGGPPVRFFPRTMTEVVVVIAWLSLGLSGIHRWLVPPTVYAAGYDDGKFRRIQVGMTADEVVSVLGEPLHRVTWNEDGTENWMYSKQYTSTSNFSRRWIFVKDGRVSDVVMDYFED